MNRRRWLIGAGCLAGALFRDWRAHGQMQVQQTGARTLDYWMGLASILGRDEFIQASETFDQSAADRGAWQARDIERLPREGVDQELVSFVTRLVQLRPKIQAAAKHARWYHGYLWRTPAVVLEARKQADGLREEMEKLRSALGKRYNCSFPPCPFPKWW